MKKKDNNKELIFNCAARLFSEKGYERTSMREIAEAAGVSKPAIYYYFENKDALFEEMLWLAINSISDTMDDIREADMDPVQKLSFIAVNRFEMYRRNPEISKFLSDIAVWNIKKQLMMNFFKKHQNVRQELNEIISDGQKKGYFDPAVDPNIAGLSFLGGMNMYLMDYIKTGVGEITPEKANEFVTTLIGGIGLKAFN